jgi:hypothetical protein
MSNNIIALSESLKKYDVKYVNGFTELENLLDFENLEDGVPKILTDRNSVLIIDLPVFNNTYLIELVNEYFDEKLQEELDEIISEDENSDNDNEMPDDDIEIDLYYIDDIKIIKRLFLNRINPRIIEGDYDTYPIGLITINPKKNDVNIYEENGITGINSKDIKYIFETYNNNE